MSFARAIADSLELYKNLAGNMKLLLFTGGCNRLGRNRFSFYRRGYIPSLRDNGQLGKSYLVRERIRRRDDQLTGKVLEGTLTDWWFEGSDIRNRVYACNTMQKEDGS